MGIMSQKNWFFYSFVSIFIITLWGLHVRYILNIHQERFVSDALMQASLIIKLKPKLPLSVHLESPINSFDTFLTLSHYQQRTNKNSVLFINKISTPILSNYHPFAPEGVAISFYRFLPDRIEIYTPKEEGLGIFIKVIGGDFFTQRRGLMLQFFYGCGIIIVFWIGWAVSLHHAQSQQESLVANDKNMQSLRQTALTDKLTQVSNRLKGEDALGELIERSNRFHQPFSIMMFDIDYFKTINDTYGHDAGDMVLINLCNYVKTLCKSSDIFVRWGGEEFLILMPGIELKDALIFANKLKEGIAAQSLLKGKTITCSFGVTSHQTREKQKSLLRRVDLLLYQAKAKGRNLVEPSIIE
jgi:diguanylate cyclase (GGDEF)-like protein